MRARSAALLFLTASQSALAFVEGPFGPSSPRTPVPVQGQASCVGSNWLHAPSTALFQTGAEAGMREPPVVIVYGYEKANGAVILPRCPAPAATLRIPVLMVDWADYDPRSDLSNPNNPASTGNPAYQPSTPQALAAYLNGPAGPRQYFHDVSNGAVEIEFHVYGWLRSGTPGAYLKSRAQYYQVWDNRYYCNHDAILRDALRDAVVQANVDFRQFDRTGTRNPGWVADAILVYEGQAGLCSGTNYIGLNGSVTPASGDQPAMFFSPDLTSLVPATDSNAALFATQTVILDNYNNIPEQRYSGSFIETGTWAHELGHALFGFSDYYYPKFRQRYWGLSGGTAASTSAPHPAAWEKWLFLRWLQPTVIAQDGTYRLDANEKPDGSGHETGSFLHVIYLDARRSRYLTLENRWFDADGNTATRWAHADGRESGLMIALFDWNHAYHDDTPHTLRQIPARAAHDDISGDRAAFRPGDRLEFCSDATCIVIDQISAPGAQMTYRVRGIERIFGDTFEAR